jgi:tetratricopeptide (TPR) repeat protein
MKKKLSIVALLMLITGIAFGQRDKLTKALRYYQAGSLDTAKLLIDSASIHPETAKDASTWYYRGYIYKDFYNQRDKANKQSAIRLEAVRSFFKQMELDTAGTYRDNVLKNVNYIANTIYNDAATSININEYPVAIANFDKYKEIILHIDSARKFNDLEIQLHSALGSIYMQIYENDREKNKGFFDKARNSFLFVIELDSNNYTANYNMGILYYNEAVNIIKGLDYDLDLITLELIQEETVELFKKALPFMLKARDLNPKRKETLIGLSGIYFSLNELEKSEEIENEIKLLDTKD